MQAASPRPVTDRRLQRELQALADSFESAGQGDVGIYVQHLRTGRTAAIHADRVAPTASMIKVPILATLFDSMVHGSLSIRQQMLYRDSLAYPGGDILASFRDSTPIELSRVVMLTETMSDNTAALWLQQLAGGGAAINDWLASQGFDSTRVNSRTQGRHGDWEKYGWGQTTPREMATLFVKIRRGEVDSPAASQEMYRILSRSFWNGEALSQIPPWVQAISKQGAVDQSRSETVLVNAPDGDYVFSVITNNQADTTWGDDNAGFVLLRKVSALLWRTFEPRHPWRPARGAEAFKPGDE